MKSLDVLYELMRSALWERPAVVDADFKDLFTELHTRVYVLICIFVVFL